MKRRTVITIAASAAAIGVVAAGIWWFSSRQPTAEQAAETYLRALEQGDFDTIDGMREAELPAAAESTLAAAFVSAAGYVADGRIVDVRTDEGTASVRADVTIDGEKRALTFALTEAGGRWLLTGDYLGLLRAEVALGTGAAGAAVWLGEALAATGADIPLLPAAYEVQAAPRGLLTGSAAAAVSTDAPATVTIDAVLSPDATAIVQERLDAYADACAQPAAAVPENCGLRVPWAVDLAALDGIAFRIEEHPVVALSEDAASFEATGGVIVATATGTTRSGESKAFTYRADDWALRGSVRFSGDEMILAVR